MKKSTIFLSLLAVCVCSPLIARADALSDNIKRAIIKENQIQTPKYYVPLIQLDEKEKTPEADGAVAPIFWVEIGGEYTADGYEAEYFYLTASDEEEPQSDGRSAPNLEPIVPAIFNEAYRRFAANPRSLNADTHTTRELLTVYYRQIQAKKAKKEQSEK